MFRKPIFGHSKPPLLSVRHAFVVFHELTRKIIINLLAYFKIPSEMKSDASSGKHQGVFFAIRDRGACLKIQSFHVRYRYCPEKVKSAVRYVDAT